MVHCITSLELSHEKLVGVIGSLVLFMMKSYNAISAVSVKPSSALVWSLNMHCFAPCPRLWHI